MATKTIKIESILGGESPTTYFGGEGQFKASYNINPEAPYPPTSVRQPSGILCQSSATKISSTTVTGLVKWIVNGEYTGAAYAYDTAGNVYKIASNYAVTDLNLTVGGTGASGDGMALYKDYIYVALQDDISRYGPLSGSPAWADDVWTGATLGSLTALTNQTYPIHNSAAGNINTRLPNHAMHVHKDQCLYFCDVKSTLEGIISKIKTTDAGTNNSSAYNVLDFPRYWWPIAIESLGNNLVIAVAHTSLGTSGGSSFQNRSKLAFWDTVSSSYSNLIDGEIPGVITAMKNVNGTLYLFIETAYSSIGYSIYRYVGGYSLQFVRHIPDGISPMQGAVSTIGSQLIWGDSRRVGSNAGEVLALGLKDGSLSNGLFSIMGLTNAGETIVGALGQDYTAGAQLGDTLPLAGYLVSGGTYGIDRGVPTTTSNAITALWHSPVFRVGEPFRIKSVNFASGVSVAANMALNVTAYFDASSTNKAVINISNTAPFTGKKRFTPRPAGARGENDFFLEFSWPSTCTVKFPVLLPITIEIETEYDGAI